jgi:hypothetical protein
MEINLALLSVFGPFVLGHLCAGSINAEIRVQGDFMKHLRRVSFLFVLFGLLFSVHSPVLANSLPLTVSVGYADNIHCASFNINPGLCVASPPATFPNPWKGSPNTIFIGQGVANVGFDSGALLLTNNSAAAVSVTDVKVKIGLTSFDLWGSFIVPKGESVILTQTGFNLLTLAPNFDTSDLTGCCSNNGVIPSILIKIGTTTTTLKDTKQILNTGGFDLGCKDPGCVLTNESHPWSLVSTPEPSSFILLGSGLLWLGAGVRRKLRR